MTTVIVWVLLVFHAPGDLLPTAGIFTHATKAECEARATAWKHYSCVSVKVERPK